MKVWSLIVNYSGTSPTGRPVMEGIRVLPAKTIIPAFNLAVMRVYYHMLCFVRHLLTKLGENTQHSNSQLWLE